MLGDVFIVNLCWACSSSTLPSGAYALWVLLWKHTLKYASYQPCWIKCMYCSHRLGYRGGGEWVPVLWWSGATMFFTFVYFWKGGRLRFFFYVCRSAWLWPCGLHSCAEWEHFLCWNFTKGKPSYPCAFTPTPHSTHAQREREAFILHEIWTYCIRLLANCIRSRPNSVKLLFQIKNCVCIFLPPVICVLHNSKFLCILQKTFRMSNAEH